MLHVNQLDVASGQLGQPLEVERIRLDDAVTILGEEHERRVDHVRRSGEGQQAARRTS